MANYLTEIESALLVGLEIIAHMKEMDGDGDGVANLPVSRLDKGMCIADINGDKPKLIMALRVMLKAASLELREYEIKDLPKPDFSDLLEPKEPFHYTKRGYPLIPLDNFCNRA